MPLNAPAEFLSGLPDAADLPLGSPVNDGEYERLMRRAGLAEGEPGTPASMFNSSI